MMIDKIFTAPLLYLMFSTMVFGSFLLVDDSWRATTLLTALASALAWVACAMANSKGPYSNKSGWMLALPFGVYAAVVTYFTAMQFAGGLVIELLPGLAFGMSVDQAQRIASFIGLAVLPMLVTLVWLWLFYGWPKTSKLSSNGYAARARHTTINDE